MKPTQKTQLINQKPTNWKKHYWEMRCVNDNKTFWHYTLRFFLWKKKKKLPCTPGTSWQEKSFCFRKGLHWTTGNFEFVSLRMLDQKFKMKMLGGAFQWVLFIEFYFEIHSFGCGKYFVMGWGWRPFPKIRHLRCSWLGVLSATILKKNKLFSTCFFFPSQELFYNKITENTLLQCTLVIFPNI